LSPLILNEAQFRESLRLGLGRAILYARDYDVSEFRNVILDACLHCYSHDVQSEGTRGSYMYDLVGCLPDKEFYYDQVLKSLAGSGDDWDAAQRLYFAGRLVFDGRADAKQAMYDAYSPGPRMGEALGINFLQMDGIKGLLFVAEKMGALLLERPEEVDEGFLHSQSVEICGEQATWEALNDAARSNVFIEKYKSVAAKSRARDFSMRTLPQQIASLSYEQVLKEFSLKKPHLLWKWGERASDDQLELAAKGLIVATDSKQQLLHLRIFERRRFPLDVRAILALVDIQEDRVGFRAVRALKHITHPAVRALAFGLMDSRSFARGGAIDLLAANYQKGDHEVVLRWFREEDDAEALHAFGMDLMKFWKQHPDNDTEVLMLRLLYEKGPCSFCRGTAVRRLIEREALAAEHRAECAWDANYDIRDLVNENPGPR
jgi:hypothetical protein